MENGMTQWDFFWKAINGLVPISNAATSMLILIGFIMLAFQVFTPWKAWTIFLGYVGKMLFAGAFQNMSDAIVGLGHDKLLYLTDKISRRGKITLKEKTNLTGIYVPYHALGGNGDGKTGYEYCMTLPVCTDEDAEEMDRTFKRREYGLDEGVKK